MSCNQHSEQPWEQESCRGSQAVCIVSIVPYQVQEAPETSRRPGSLYDNGSTRWSKDAWLVWSLRASTYVHPPTSSLLEGKWKYQNCRANQSFFILLPLSTFSIILNLSAPSPQLCLHLINILQVTVNFTQKSEANGWVPYLVLLFTPKGIWTWILYICQNS